MYDLVPVGGVVYLDDYYSHRSVYYFWRDFKADYGLSEPLHDVDWTAVWFQKERDITLNFTKRRHKRKEDDGVLLPV